MFFTATTMGEEMSGVDTKAQEYIIRKIEQIEEYLETLKTNPQILENIAISETIIATGKGVGKPVIDMRIIINESLYYEVKKRI